jgi:hypothetical protein
VLRRESNVRVSIVVPHLGDDAAFEDSLVSVLENRPADAEVCVAHDGRYTDPFDLGDEVRFVTDQSRSLPQLITAAVAVANGRVVHVIGDGVKATEGWTCEALAKFEHDDVAMVSPVARVAIDDRITAAGWTSGMSGLSTPIAAQKLSLGSRDAASIHGVCLTASFWRRDVLQNVTQAFPTTNADAAQFAWSRMVCRQGWRGAIADQSVVIADPMMLGLSRSPARGATMRAIQAKLKGESFTGSAMSVGLTAVTNFIRPSAWGEVAGEAMTLLTGSKVTRLMDVDAVRTPADQVKTIRMPFNVPSTAARRAA